MSQDKIVYNMEKSYENDPNIVWMPPLAFLKRSPYRGNTAISAANDILRGEPLEEVEKYFYKPSLESIRTGLLKGEEFYPLMLDYDDMYYGWPSHEGRHRALVAYELGIEEVPVIYIRTESTTSPLRKGSSWAKNRLPRETNSNLNFYTPEPPFEYEDIYPVDYSSNGLILKVMRAGKEFKDDVRGGTWYQIEIWPGQTPTYAIGTIAPGVVGVGGKEIWRKTILLKNPYYIDITDKIEAEYPLVLYEELFMKKAPMRGLMGAKAEERYAKIERDIAAELINKDHDGAVFYYIIGVRSVPTQVFVVAPSRGKELLERKNNDSKEKEEKIVYHPKLTEI